MKKLTLTAAMSACMTLAATVALAGENRNESRLDVAADGAVNIADSAGVVNVHSAPGRQVLVVSVTRSAKVEIDQTVTPDKKRVEIVVHAVAGQKPSADEARVDLDVAVPAGVSVSVSSATAPITVDGLSGNIISVSSDTGQITVRNSSKAHLHARSVTAPVALNNFANGFVEIVSAGGAVQLTRVFGPLVTVGTTSGNITYQGDCSGGGTYTLTTHSGEIDVTLPETASVDLSARSISGSVQNDFPLKEKTHASFTPKPGSSFTGTSLSGSSSVELESFSGRIRVKKQ